MDSWKTFGHFNNKKLLELQLKSGKFAHAYLFVGPEGVGKKLMALELAQKILQTGNLNTHPDFAILDQVEDINVERMQQFMEGLSFKPFVGLKKVAVINNAHLMNNQSANALLKTLEEPSASTVLILVSANKNLLSTIISRCQTFFFNSFSLGQLKEFCSANEVNASDELLKLSFGSIGRLIKLQDGEFLEKEKSNIKELENLERSQSADRLLTIAKFAEWETPDLQSLFSSWLFWQRQSLAINMGARKSMPYMLSALEQLNTNKNKKLILQDLFLKL